MIINGSGQGHPSERFVLVWSNNNPGSEFVPQTIELDMSCYSMFVIMTKCSTSHDSYNCSFIMNVVEDRSWGISASHLLSSSAGSISTSRDVTVSETGITFSRGSGTVTALNGEQTAEYSDAYAIPYRIYAMY